MRRHSACRISCNCWLVWNGFLAAFLYSSTSATFIASGLGRHHRDLQCKKYLQNVSSPPSGLSPRQVTKTRRTSTFNLSADTHQLKFLVSDRAAIPLVALNSMAIALKLSSFLFPYIARASNLLRSHAWRLSLLRFRQRHSSLSCGLFCFPLARL